MSSKICTNCKQSKDLNCFSKKAARPDGLGCWCKQCVSAAGKIYGIKNKDKRKNYSVEYYRKNRDILLKKCNDYKTDNKELVSNYNKIYTKTNSSKINALNIRRYARKIKASPKWITKEQEKEIRGFYEEAKLKTLKTGIKHEVDHIVPLISKVVCGLHVPWNLQVLTKIENIRKNNKII